MKKVVIIGGGPSGLMTAYQLSKSKQFDITVFDANKAVARKFLVAGHGGFNLSNAKDSNTFISNYNHSIIQEAFHAFDNHAVVSFLNEIGVETYVGSSGKLFPKVGIKPIDVLNAWISMLKDNGVRIVTNHELVDFDSKQIVVQNNDTKTVHIFDYCVLALGGASWKKTGSTGTWFSLFKQKQFDVIPFEASNAGMIISNWDTHFEGNVLKNVLVQIADRQLLGEVVLTTYGVEGPPIYALNQYVRSGISELSINFKPQLSFDELTLRFSKFKGNKSEFLSSLKLSKIVIRLFKRFLSKAEFLDDETFLRNIVEFKLSVDKLRPIDEAISSVGGLSMNEMTSNFELKKNPNIYAVGEMLDWDAPTGGYLLQACFASGFVAAKSIIDKSN
ncbi:MAG TPA: TIGR03862 family flavoprotein [Taishania sp.]|nr:TIGR03862 family flavoprotein [Taishania sp.]